jgi:two-component system phosphate regulon sensor histidine kinase PhoR
MLAVLVPTVLLTGVGILLVVFSERTPTILLGVLVLTLCTTGITGYILGSVFVGKGASLIRLQNDYLSSVSHELRTPLTSISLLLESLGPNHRGTRLGDAERDQVLSLLGQETKRLEVLVARFLELQRLQSGRHIFAKAPLDLNEAITEAIRVFDTATLSKPTPIQLDVEPNLVALGDLPTLVRAIANLLHNAWKYSGEDKQISITAHNAGRWVEVIVRDNGFGIAQGEHREVFEEFSRGQAARDSGAPGLGLGLAFVRAIVRGHRGKIVLASRPEGGTEFRIRLRRSLRAAIGAPTPVTTP